MALSPALEPPGRSLTHTVRDGTGVQQGKPLSPQLPGTGLPPETFLVYGQQRPYVKFCWTQPRGILAHQPTCSTFKLYGGRPLRDSRFARIPFVSEKPLGGANREASE